ncbi:DUF1295 domain-containing protein [Candidatus Woesearchaeota archaeon]|nr:DUF1295 domain-containing protein [Candidatus Woesearchaeota archaeon]
MLTIWHYLLISLGIQVVMFLPAFKFKTDKLTDLSYALTFIILALLAFFLSSYSALKLVAMLMVVAWGLRLGTFLFIRIRKMKTDKRFDGIRENFFRFLRFWILQGLTVWIILIPVLLLMGSESAYTPLTFLGLAVWFTGLLTEATADFQKSKFVKLKTGKWIETGLWKYSRHPNYFGEILCWVGVYLFAFSSLTPTFRLFGLASPLFIMILLLFVTGLPPLEKGADQRWGSESGYQEYKRRTSVLIPWFRRK